MINPIAEGRRLIVFIGMIILIIALIAFGTSQCAKRRNAASQARVDASQAAAVSESAKDAIATQGAANERETASEATTRFNERTIRDAQGSNDAVNPALRDAGFASLCKRPSFANSPTGKLRCNPPAGVEAGR